MLKIIATSTLIATAALQVSADPLNGLDLSTLPAEVAEEVIKLQQHGNRFEPAIKAILAENAKPKLGFDCGADDHLARIFDVEAIRDIKPTEIGHWYAASISNPMTPVLMDRASATGIKAILAGLLDSGAASRIVAALDTGSAQPLFTILFHPALLEVLVEETDARQEAWSSLVDAVEELFWRDS